MNPPAAQVDARTLNTPRGDHGRLIARLLVFLAVCACVGLRLWMWRYHAPRALTMDEYLYLNSTAWFHDTGEIDTIARGPAYPVFMAWMFRLLPLDLLAAIYTTHVAISAACCVMLYSLGARYFGRATGVIAAWLFAIDPTLAAYSLFVFNELFYIFVLLIGTMVFLSAVHRRSWLLMATTGLIFGAATLTRGQSVLLSPFMLAWVVLALRAKSHDERSPGVAPTGDNARNGVQDNAACDQPTRPPATWSHAFRCGAALTVCWLLVVLPWTIRNYRKFDTLLLVDTTAARTLWHANRIPFRVAYSWPFGKYVANPINGPLPHEDDRSAPEHSELLKQELRFVVEHPGLIAGRVPEKLAALLNPTSFFQLSMYKHGMPGWESGSDAAVRISIVTTLIWGLILFPSVFGLLHGHWRNPLWRFAVINIVLTLAIHSVMVSQSRYRMSIMPFLILLAAAALATPLKHLKLKSPRTWSATLLVIILAFGWRAYWPFVIMDVRGMENASKLPIDNAPRRQRSPRQSSVLPHRRQSPLPSLRDAGLLEVTFDDGLSAASSPSAPSSFALR